MRNEIDIEAVKERYRQMSNAELEYFATKDAAGLTAEAQELVKAEIARRGLGDAVIESVAAQNKGLTVAELEAYCELLRPLSCPVCKRDDVPLNGTLVNTVMSFIVFTQQSSRLLVACPTCLDKANDNALTQSAVLGWWGIPWGIVYTIQAIKQNSKCKKTNHAQEANDYLKRFVLATVGQIELHKDNMEELQKIIAKS